MRVKGLILLIFFVSILSAQQSGETILKMQTEQDIAARLESQLYPFVGKTVVLVDLELEYAKNLVQAFGMDLDEQESLPGLPVSRSTTAVLPQGTERHNQVQIISKDITVYINKKTKKDHIEFIEKQINSWYDITAENTSTLSISPILEPVKEKGMRGSFIIFGILLSFLLFMLMINLKSALLYLAKSVKSTNISGFDKPLQVKGNMGSSLPAGFQTQSPFRMNDNKPVPIKIISDPIENIDSTDFTYLDSLSIESFHKLINQCPPENVNLVLSNISPQFLKEFYLSHPDMSAQLIPVFLDTKPKTKTEIRKIHKEVNELYLKLNEEDTVESDGTTTLISLLNNLPYQKSEELLKNISATDAERGKMIRDRLFLLDDILTLDDDVIEDVYRNISHDLLVGFLASVEGDIRSKILASMTPRAQMILEEDIQILGKLSQDDKYTAIHEMLQTIRTQLKY